MGNVAGAPELEEAACQKRILGGSPVVSIYVGPEAEHYLVHKKPLCQLAPFFDKALSSTFKEGQEQVVRLPEDSTHNFNKFLEWLYAGKKVLLVFDKYDEGYHFGKFFNDTVELHEFAHKYGITELKKDTLEAIEKIANDNWVPSVPSCPTVHNVLALWRCTDNEDDRHEICEEAASWIVNYIQQKGDIHDLDEVQEEHELSMAVMKAFAQKCISRRPTTDGWGQPSY